MQMETEEEKAVAESSSSGACKTQTQRSHNNHNTVVKAISNIKMTNPIKKLVSQSRIRYTKDGFNLDLTCILYFIINCIFNFSFVFYLMWFLNLCTFVVV